VVSHVCTTLVSTMKQNTTTMTLRDLKEGQFFMFDNGDEIRNKYQVVKHSDCGYTTCKLVDEFFDFWNIHNVEPLTGEAAHYAAKR